MESNIDKKEWYEKLEFLFSIFLEIKTELIFEIKEYEEFRRNSEINHRNQVITGPESLSIYERLISSEIKTINEFHDSIEELNNRKTAASKELTDHLSGYEGLYFVVHTDDGDYALKILSDGRHTITYKTMGEFLESRQS